MIKYRARNHLLLECFREWNSCGAISDRIDENSGLPQAIPRPVNWRMAAGIAKMPLGEAKQVIEQWILCGWVSHDPPSVPDNVLIKCGDGIYYFTSAGISECERRLQNKEIPWYLRPWFTGAASAIAVILFERAIEWFFF